MNDRIRAWLRLIAPRCGCSADLRELVGGRVACDRCGSIAVAVAK